MKRGDMAAHEEDDKLHLHMAIDMTAKLSAEFREDREKLFNKISTLEDEKVKLLDKMCTLESNSITVKVVDVQDGIDRVNYCHWILFFSHQSRGLLCIS